MIAFEKLITPVTEEQFLERFLTTLEVLGLRARSWRPKGVYRTILAVLAATCAAFSDLQVRFTRSAFLELSEGDWLTWVAFYVYGVARPEATFAAGKATLTNAGGGNFPWTAGQLRIFNPDTKKAYTNAADFTLVPLGTITIDIIAIEQGSSSSSIAGTITEIETQFAEQGVTVTNAEPVVGSDAMQDAELKQLCLDKIAARSAFGPRGAYRYAIRSAKRENGSTVDINRFSISMSSSKGTIDIIVASPSGVPSNADVAAVEDNVEEIARPDPAVANVSAATGKSISRGITIWAKKQPGLKASDLQELAAKEIIALNRSYPVGGIRKSSRKGFFWATNLDGAIQKAHPAIYAVDGVGADEELAPNEVAVLAVTIDDVRIVDAEVH